MTALPILRELAVATLGAAVFLAILRPVGLPGLLSFMAAGLVLGPATGLLGEPESVHLLSELGILLLLFLVGMELTLETLRAVGRDAVLVALVQVPLTAAAGWGVARMLGYGDPDAALLGLAVAFSSTVVVVSLLTRSGETASEHGSLAIGILLVQDVLIALVLTLVAALGGGAGAAGAGGIAGEVARILGGLLLLGGLAWAAVRWILPPVFRWLAGRPEAFFVAAVTWLMLLVLASEALRLSPEIGAFLAGLALAQLEYVEETRRRVHPLADFLLAIFFVTLGAESDPGAILDHAGLVLALVAVVLLGKPVLVHLLLRALGRHPRTAFLSGASLGQTSEFSLVLVAAAAASGLAVTEASVSVVPALALVTMAVSALVMPSAGRFREAVRRRWGRALEAATDTSSTLREERSGHVVVVGMNPLGRRLVRRLRERGLAVLAVDIDPGKLRGLPAETLLGSADDPDLLEHAGIDRALLVVSAVQIEDVNALLAHRCRVRGVPVAVQAWDPTVADELLEIGASHLMVPKYEGIRLAREELRRIGVGRAPT